MVFFTFLESDPKTQIHNSVQIRIQIRKSVVYKAGLITENDPGIIYGLQLLIRDTTEHGFRQNYLWV